MRLTLAEPWPVFAGLLAAVAVIGVVVLTYRSLRGIVDRRTRTLFTATRPALMRCWIGVLIVPGEMPFHQPPLGN